MEAYPDTRETELVQSAREGNRESLSRLLHDAYPRVFGYIVKLCADRELASDIVQGAMEHAIRKFETYRPEKGAFSTWVTRIAVNLLIDHYRKSKRETPVEFMPEGAIEPEAAGDVNAVIQNLPLPLRLPLMMQFLLGYSQKEIAKALHIPVGTVKSRVHNALKLLRKELDYEKED